MFYDEIYFSFTTVKVIDDADLADAYKKKRVDLLNTVHIKLNPLFPRLWSKKRRLFQTLGYPLAFISFIDLLQVE